MEILHIANFSKRDERFNYMKNISNIQEELGHSPILLLNKRPPEINFNVPNMRILPGKKINYLKLRLDKNIMHFIKNIDIAFAYTYSDLSLILYLKKKLKKNFKVVYILIDWRGTTGKGKRISKRIDKLIFLSEHERFLLSRKLRIKPDDSFVLFGNYPSFKCQGSNGIIKKYKIPGDSVKFLIHTDYLRANKPKEILNAISFLSDEDYKKSFFIFSGKEKDYTKLDLITYAKFKKVNSRCIFINPREREYPELFGLADVGLLFTKRRIKFPESIFQYMSCGIPVIVSNSGIISEIIDSPETGIIIQQDDEQGLSIAIANLINDKKLRTAIAKNAKAVFLKSYSYNKFKESSSLILNSLGFVKNMKNKTT
ncbi:glycosyltransferase family 4 protein [Candidatus Dependentiae bacterium]|nr:glycosyltransferase family 4 protein [Candidatus Dependentiae bacterium]